MIGIEVTDRSKLELLALAIGRFDYEAIFPNGRYGRYYFDDQAAIAYLVKTGLAKTGSEAEDLWQAIKAGELQDQNKIQDVIANSRLNEIISEFKGAAKFHWMKAEYIYPLWVLGVTQFLNLLKKSQEEDPIITDPDLLEKIRDLQFYKGINDAKILMEEDLINYLDERGYPR